MLSAGRIVSRFTVRAIVSNHAFASVRQPTNLRYFGSASFLDAGEVTERIVQVVQNFDKVDRDKVTPESKFAEDLGLDSLDAVEIVMAIEDEFAVEIPDAEADKIASIGDAVEYITAHPMAK